MLFGDEKRFAKPMTPSSKDGQVYATKVGNNTDKNIGPGCYFLSEADEQRNGWKKKSFSRREPMTPSTNERANRLSRSDFYTHGVMTSYGAMAIPTDSPKRASPGPGYYERDIIRSPSGRSLHSPNSSYSLYATNNTGATTPRATATTPRFAFDQSAVLKNGVLFVSRENNAKDIGPGQYAIPMDTMRKPSFNVRASNGKEALSPNMISRKPSANDTMLAASGSSSSAQRARAKSAPRMRR